MSLRVCVFCGSSPGSSPMYVEEATNLGNALAEARIGLVYGGGGVGSMGAVARALKENGGHVTGVVPQSLLDSEPILDPLDALHVVSSYHERKMLMYHLSDGFVVLPGGPGTLEELMEHLTWMHRGRQRKPVYVVNQMGYWDPLLEMFDSMRRSGFISSDFSTRYSIFGSAYDAIADFKENWSHVSLCRFESARRTRT
jgi:uncharacterized protein (TIGR00730 family)